MKSLYKFNANKYIAVGLELGAKPDMRWALANDGKSIKINKELGLGALDGRIVLIEACDETEEYTLEDTTYLEELLFRSNKKAVRELAECKELLERFSDMTDKQLDEINSLMSAHNALLDIILKYNEELSKDFLHEIAEKVILKVLETNITSDLKEHECDLNCSDCSCK